MDADKFSGFAKAAEIFHDMEARAKLDKKYGQPEPSLAVAIAVCRKNGYTVSRHKRTSAVGEK